MNGNTIIQQSSNATFQTVAGEAILIRMDTGTYYSLNAIGTEFWEMLDGQKTITDHATVIANKYEVDVPMVTADMVELSESLLAEKLVDVVSD